MFGTARPVVAVDGDVAALVDLRRRSPRGPCPPVQPERPLEARTFSASISSPLDERRHDAAARRRGGCSCVVCPRWNVDAERLHRAAQALADLGVEERQEARAALDERHLHVHRREHRRVLAADDAAADDEHRLREAIDLEDGVRVVDVLVVERDVRRVVRLRARGHEEHLARDPPGRAAAAGDLDGVGVDEARRRRGGAGTPCRSRFHWMRATSSSRTASLRDRSRGTAASVLSSTLRP